MLLKKMTLPINAIIDPSWARALRRFANGSTVYYWLNQRARRFADGTQTEVISSSEASFIRRTFETIDRLTGLSFIQTTSRGRSSINIYKVSRYSSDPTLLGQTSLGRDQFQITWRDRGGNNVTRQERITITHEIGHSVGLNHPFNRPWSPRYTTNDTIMSYNDARNTSFTSTDIAALRQLWGFDQTSASTNMA